MPHPVKFVPDSSGLSDYFTLWKHFEDTGDLFKDRMVTVVSLLLGFAAVILGYIVTNNLVFERPGSMVCVEKPGQAILFSIAGLLICLYSGYLVMEFGGYARNNWARADQLKCMMPVLQVLMKDTPKAQSDTFQYLDFVRRQWKKFGAMTQGFKIYLFIVGFTCLLFVAVLILAFVVRC